MRVCWTSVAGIVPIHEHHFDLGRVHRFLVRRFRAVGRCRALGRGQLLDPHLSCSAGAVGGSRGNLPAIQFVGRCDSHVCPAPGGHGLC